MLSCRVEQDRYTRQLYAEVGLESYFDVLKCVNAMHGTHYEGRQLEVKKVRNDCLHRVVLIYRVVNNILYNRCSLDSQIKFSQTKI